MIRAARPDDLEQLREIERSAGKAFYDVNMAPVADDEPPSLSVLIGYQLGDRAWVSCDETDEPVAYLLVDIVADWLHIAQLSVHPNRAREGLGRGLIDWADHLAAERDLAGLILTTFARVPWNAPYYARLGFRVVPDDFSAGVAEIRTAESGREWDAWPRVVMVREVGSSGSTERPDP